MFSKSKLNRFVSIHKMCQVFISSIFVYVKPRLVRFPFHKLTIYANFSVNRSDTSKAHCPENFFEL